MLNVLGMLPEVCETAITFGVPALVWLLLVAGLYQLAREQVRQHRPAPRRTERLAEKSAG